jgi:negative regulator of flagellin synthesis FlgM
MKINESQRLSSIQAYRAGKQSQEAKAAAGGKSARKDNIQISAEAKELLEAQRLNVGNRSEKLEDLKQAVQSGTYQVGADKLAERLLPYLK